jgi:hypothetical protein
MRLAHIKRSVIRRLRHKKWASPAKAALFATRITIF